MRVDSVPGNDCSLAGAAHEACQERDAAKLPTRQGDAAKDRDRDASEIDVTRPFWLKHRLHYLPPLNDAEQYHNDLGPAPRLVRLQSEPRGCSAFCSFHPEFRARAAVGGRA